MHPTGCGDRFRRLLAAIFHHTTGVRTACSTTTQGNGLRNRRLWDRIGAHQGPGLSAGRIGYEQRPFRIVPMFRAESERTLVTEGVRP